MSKKIEPLWIKHGSNKGADLLLHVDRTLGVIVSLDGSGFGAHRNLTADDLRDLRDWINTALASVEPHTEGVGE